MMSLRGVAGKLTLAIPVQFAVFHSNSFHSTPHHFAPYHSTALHCISLRFHSIPLHSNLLCKSITLQDAEVALQQGCPYLTPGDMERLRRSGTGPSMIDHKRVLGVADTAPEQRKAEAKKASR